MATNILASGTTAAQSASFTLADGASSNLILKGQGTVQVQIQDATGWTAVGFLDSQYPVKTVSGPGNFRVAREAVGTALAVDRE